MLKCKHCNTHVFLPLITVSNGPRQMKSKQQGHPRKKPLWGNHSASRGLGSQSLKHSTPTLKTSPGLPSTYFCGKETGEGPYLHGMLHKRLGVEKPLEQHLPGSHSHLEERTVPVTSKKHNERASHLSRLFPATDTDPDIKTFCRATKALRVAPPRPLVASEGRQR